MTWLTFDSETDALELDEITRVWCIATVDMETMEVKSYGPSEIKEALDSLSKAEMVVGHNCIGFDFPVFAKLYGWKPKNYLDTLVLSRLSNPDRQKPFGLKGNVGPHSVEAWGYRLQNHKVEHEDWSQFSAEMMKRCKQDAMIQVQIYKTIADEMS